MLSLKSKPGEVVTFARAPELNANGYEPINLPWGAEIPPGPWGVSYHYRPFYAETYGSEAMAVLTDVRPVLGCALVPLDYCKSTWLAALRVQIFGDKGLARAVDDLVNSRLVWRDGVDTRLSPVRLDVDGTRSTLRVFALADSEYQTFEGPRMRYLGYVMPGDPAPEKRYLRDYRANKAEWISAMGQFPYSADTEGRPYEWTDGGLLAVPRSALPVITADGARTMLTDIEQLMASRGEPWM
jgi:hypothetical protein